VRVKEIPRTFVVRLVEDASMPSGHRIKVMSIDGGLGMSSQLHVSSDSPGNAIKQT
jgi:hypothetical protein